MRKGCGDWGWKGENTFNSYSVESIIKKHVEVYFLLNIILIISKFILLGIYIFLLEVSFFQQFKKFFSVNY